jgi:hypothetical protein
MRKSGRAKCARALSALILLAAVSGCSGSPVGVSATVSFQPLRTGSDDNDYDTARWLGESAVVVGIRAADQSVADARTSDTRWILAIGTDRLDKLVLPRSLRCDSYAFYVRDVLPADTVLFSVDCVLRRPSFPFGTSNQFAFEYGIGSNSLRQLNDTVLDGDQFGDGVTRFEWQPMVERGIAERMNGMCWRMSYFSKKGTEVPDIVIEDGALRWRLADEFVPENWNDCLNRGAVRGPAWSRDSKTISFLASPDAGKGYLGFGTSRLRAGYKLFLMDYPGTVAKPVLGPVYDPGEARWSPDSRYLAFTAATAPLEGRYLWIFDKLTAKAIRVANEELREFSWSPDSRRILVIRNIKGPDGVERGKLYVFDNPL